MDLLTEAHEGVMHRVTEAHVGGWIRFDLVLVRHAADHEGVESDSTLSWVGLRRLQRQLNQITSGTDWVKLRPTVASCDSLRMIDKVERERSKTGQQTLRQSVSLGLKFLKIDLLEPSCKPFESYLQFKNWNITKHMIHVSNSRDITRQWNQK